MSPPYDSIFISRATRSERSRRRMLAAVVSAVVAVMLACAALAPAARAASWQFAPVAGPPPPIGVSPAPYAVPLGQVGQISFWAPNRGLLITGGTETRGGVVPAGLYAYDGVSWHLLSTVCGGAYGRIAWAGPDDFWTISDQRPGQVTSAVEAPGNLESMSLCHFLNGQVVASYAMPLNEPDSYRQMDAAACDGPDDCWFGGQDTTGSTPGAFQLHWDGANLTALQEPEDHAVNDMTEFQGQIYESVRLEPTDLYLAGESTTHPAVLHTIGTGENGPFTDVFTFGGGKQLPVYGQGVAPDALEGFSLATDGDAQGTGATQLWGVANPVSSPPQGSEPASLTILRRTTSGWSQVLPPVAATTGTAAATGAATCTPLPAGTTVASWPATPGDGTTSGSIAPLPGTSSAWLSLTAYDADGNPGSAVALINAQGCMTELDQLTQAPGQSSAPGGTGPIACPAANDCWMATISPSTTSSGWLYHYTDGTQYAQDTDPNFAGVITVRPADAGTPTLYGDVPPVDDSLANQVTTPAPTGPAKATPATTKKKKAKPLVTKIKSKLVHRTTLVMSFQLSARARVQVVCQRKKKVVARSKRRLLRPGRRSLSVRLNRKRWPTKVQINAKAVASS